MKAVQALSISATLLPILRAGSHARVHSIFARALNLIVGEDRLLTLACHELGDAPDTVVVDAPHWRDSSLDPGTEVHLATQRIQIGANVEVRLQGAQPWQCRLPAWTTGSALARKHLPLALEHVRRCGRSFAWIPPLLSDSLPDADAVVAATLRRRAQGLCDAVINGDEARARQHIFDLIGLGSGLTPSGDDFVLGWLLVMSLAKGPCHGWSSVAAQAVQSATSRTHLISATALRHAVEGRARQLLVDLCEALLHGDEPQVHAALDHVIRIGANSGSDIALGILRGFDLQLRATRPPQAMAA